MNTDKCNTRFRSTAFRQKATSALSVLSAFFLNDKFSMQVRIRVNPWSDTYRTKNRSERPQVAKAPTNQKTSVGKIPGYFAKTNSSCPSSRSTTCGITSGATAGQPKLRPKRPCLAMKSAPT